MNEAERCDNAADLCDYHAEQNEDMARRLREQASNLRHEAAGLREMMKEATTHEPDNPQGVWCCVPHRASYSNGTLFTEERN